MLPQDQAVVITVSQCRVVVCRCRHRPDGSITYECARNAEALEGNAMLALAKSGQPFRTGQEFPCPQCSNQYSAAGSPHPPAIVSVDWGGNPLKPSGLSPGSRH
jgi:hypothetical protein